MHSNIPYQQRYQVLYDLNEYLIDLPHLNSIKLGRWVLAGSGGSSCSLIMESNIDMNEIMYRSS